MQKVKIGLIRVISFEDKKLIEFHGKLIEKHFPDLQIISKCIKDQPKGIYNEETKKIAIPKIIELGSRFATEEKAEVIIISCADDPGVKELRKLVQVPVIGAGSSVSAVALSYGSRVGTLGITEKTPPIMQEILGEHLVAEAKPRGVKTTLDLMTDKGRENAFKSVKYLKEKGAEAIALACTGYSTIGIANDLEKAIGIPVLDAAIAAGLFAWYFTRGEI